MLYEEQYLSCFESFAVSYLSHKYTFLFLLF